MTFCKITAIIRSERLEKVEHALQDSGQSGITVTKVKGYGELRNPFNNDWMEGHMRIELFTHTEKSDELVRVIMNAAHIGLAGDGIIAILPVQKIYRIREKKLIKAGTT